MVGATVSSFNPRRCMGCYRDFITVGHSNNNKQRTPPCRETWSEHRATCAQFWWIPASQCLNGGYREIRDTASALKSYFCCETGG